MFNKPLSIAFEGMHRSGKSTQIERIRGLLNVSTISSSIIRGAGSRLGTNDLLTEYHDPVDNYWIKFGKDRGLGSEDWVEAAYKINSEILDFSNSLDVDIILMDRCYISNNFLVVLLGEDPISYSFVPDLVFYLRVSKKTLLERVENDYSCKRVFRKKNIEQNYERYTSYIENMLCAHDFITINGEEASDNIHEIIKRNIWLKIKQLIEEQ